MLSKVECLRILELGPGADSYEIENRYTMLIKRYRGKPDVESVASLDQITMAYNILTGRYIEPEPEDPRLEKVVFGRSFRQWKNIWHYGRVPLLIGILGAAFLFYFIYTVATNKPLDFQISFIGLFGKTEAAEKNTEEYILKQFPDFNEIEVFLLPLDFRTTGNTSENDGTSSGGVGENRYEYLMKMLTMIAGDTYEVYVCDPLVFDHYAPQGAFADLTAFYSDLQKQIPADVLAKVKPLYRAPLDDDDDEATNAEPVLYGLDVSELRLSQGLGFYTETQILTMGVKASAANEAMAFLKNWISDFQEMNTRQSEYEASLPTESK